MRSRQKVLSPLIVIILILSMLSPLVRPVSPCTMTVEIKPERGHVGTLVTVSGTSKPGYKAEIYWDIVQDPFTSGAGKLNSTNADGDGDYSAEVIVPKSVFGPHIFIVVDEAGNKAEATFTVEAKIEITGGSIGDDEGLYYDTLTLYGTGFAPEAEVIITWEDLKFWMESTITDDFGSFHTCVSVPDSLGAGEHVITAACKEDATITALANFTLYYIWNSEGQIYIDTPRLMGKFCYNENEFYQVYWAFYHNSLDRWETVMCDYYCTCQSKVPGLQVLRIKYDGVTYLHDLASRYQKDLYEEVVCFQQISSVHVQGTIRLYREFEGELLVTVLVDIYVPPTAEDYYAMIFTLTPEAPLEDLAFYNAYDPVRMYSAYYDGNLDFVYASDYTRLYPWESYFAGFGSVLPRSTYHDVRHDWQDVQVLDNLKDYDYNYRNIDRNEDSFRSGGMGLQWDLGQMSVESTASISLVFVVGEESPSAHHEIPEPFAGSIREAKLWIYSLLTTPKNITLTPDTGVGFSVATISGSGFIPYANVDIYFEGVPTISFVTDEVGAFESNFIIPVTKEGIYTITATDEYGLQASASFEVINLVMARLLAIEIVADKLYAVLDTDLGEIVTGLKEINATLVAVQGEVVIIQSDIGTIKTTLNIIDGRLTTIEGDLITIYTTLATISGKIKMIEDNIATIETSIGTIQLDLASINGRITAIEGNIATISTDIGSINLSLSNIDAKIVDLIGDIAVIETGIGNIEVKLDKINPIITSIANGIVNINTTICELKLRLDEINATLLTINGTIATIEVKIDTKVSILFGELADIGAKGIDLEGDIATIRTDLGTLTGVVTSINGTIVTIETDIGKAHLDITDILEALRAAAGLKLPTYTYILLIVTLIAAAAAIALPLYLASRRSKEGQRA